MRGLDGVRGAASPDAAIKAYEVTPEDPDGAYVETVSLQIPASAAALQEHVFWIFAGATSDMDRAPSGKRKTAVVYPYPLAVHYEVAVTGASKSSKPPDPLKLAGAGWSVESETDGGGHSMIKLARERSSTPGFSRCQAGVGSSSLYRSAIARSERASI